MLDTFMEMDVDVIQIGTRNMQNFDCSRRSAASTSRDLKRGMSATINEWLMAAEYIAAGGNHQHHLLRARHRYFRDVLPQRCSTSPRYLC